MLLKTSKHLYTAFVPKYLNKNIFTCNVALAKLVSAKKPCTDLPDDPALIQLLAFRKKQEFFQRKDGKPIFLKHGIRDQLLYRFTVLLAIYGTIRVVCLILGLMFK